jgi:thiopeptide-type bacteriocin biosynthesis protein
MEFLDRLFLRTPFYSYARYDLARLPEILQQVPFRNALRLASPVIYAQLEKKDFDYNKLTTHEQFTLAKYYNRMCFRPTPFGGFVAFTLLEWGGGDVQLKGEPDCRLLLLPDNASREPAAGGQLIKNPTLYRLGSSWRYYCSAVNTKGHHEFTIDELDAVRFNNELLERCGRGIERPELLRWISQAAGCPLPDAEDYLGFLLDEQVLYPAGRGAVISGETAAAVPAGSPLNGGAYYAALERPLVSGGPAAADREELAAVLAALHQVAAPVALPDLDKFIHDFSARFELEKVPLLTALDPDSGIAYGGISTAGRGLLADIPFPVGKLAPAQLDWSLFRQLLFRKWPADGEILVIRPADLAALNSSPPPALPNTLAVMYRQTGAGLLLEQAAGTSATQLLGRFSAFSDEVHALCRSLAVRETAANPGVVFADIGQLSNRHYDNINRRKPIYGYELPLNVCSQLPAGQQLLPEDLVLSVRDGQLLLESRRPGKRVIPRLATAYNYRHTQSGLFQLLCDLGYQGLTGSLLPDLEALFPGLAHYPRLVYDRTILAPAKWRFNTADLAALSLENLAAFREKHRLPQLVAIGEADRQLVFDLAESAEAGFFLKCLASAGNMLLQEHLPPVKNIRCGHKPLAGQYIAVFTHDQAIYQPAAEGGAKKSTIKRVFPPGSEWLYLKLYCTPATADRLLTEVVRPVLRNYAHRLGGWFFVRYTDGAYHLRLRFKFTGADSGSLLAALQARLAKTRLAQSLHGFQADTYRRELERYGPALITRAEKVFEAGSDLVINQLQTEITLTEFGRACVTARLMISCFYPEKGDQLTYIAWVRDLFLSEFDADKKLRLELDRKYRSLKIEINAGPLGGTGPLEKVTAEIAALAAGKSATRRRELLVDLVHLQLNRVFASDPRRQELLTYYCLHKAIAGELSRATADQQR